MSWTPKHVLSEMVIQEGNGLRHHPLRRVPESSPINMRVLCSRQDAVNTITKVIVS